MSRLRGEPKNSNDEWRDDSEDTDELPYRGFDMHGVYVVDELQPISCPPLKGVLADVKLVAAREIGLSSCFGWNDNLQPYFTPSGGHHFDALASWCSGSRTPHSTGRTAAVNSHHLGEAMEVAGSIIVVPICLPEQLARTMSQRCRHTQRWAYTTDSQAVPEASSERPNECPGGYCDGFERNWRLRRIGAASPKLFRAIGEAHSYVQRRATWTASAPRSLEQVYWFATARPRGHGAIPQAENGSTRIASPADLIVAEEVLQCARFNANVKSRQQPQPLSPTVAEWISELGDILLDAEARGAAGVVYVCYSKLWLSSGDLGEQELGWIDTAQMFPTGLRLGLRIYAGAVVVPLWELKAALEPLQEGKPGFLRQAFMPPIPVAPGDHLYRALEGSLGMVTHHGIYLGHGRIIHFNTRRRQGGGLLALSSASSFSDSSSIAATSICQFIKSGCRLYVQIYDKADCVPPLEVLRRAEEALQFQCYPAYNLFSNNCEHFCSYCKTGRHRSAQVDTAVSLLQSALHSAGRAVGRFLESRNRK